MKIELKDLTGLMHDSVNHNSCADKYPRMQGFRGDLSGLIWNLG